MVDANTGENVHALEEAETRVGIMLNRDSGRFFAKRLLPLLVGLSEPCLVEGHSLPIVFTYTRREVPAAAVVVNVGALLSHAVIVSRELGIPCVVAVDGATEKLADGMLLAVDGTKGTVTVME